MVRHKSAVKRNKQSIATRARNRNNLSQLKTQVKKLRTQLDKNPVVQRAQNLRTDAVKTLETGVDQILGTIRVAPHSEIQRLERKVNFLHFGGGELPHGKAPGTAIEA